MTTKDEALKMALQSLEYYERNELHWDASDKIAIAACREALAQKDEQEQPVAWKRRLVEIHDALSYELGDTDPHIEDDMTDEEVREEMPVFWAAKEVAKLIGDAPWDSLPSAPPKRQPLTDEKLRAMWVNYAPIVGGVLEFARAIEAAHGIGVEHEPR